MTISTTDFGPPPRLPYLPGFGPQNSLPPLPDEDETSNYSDAGDSSPSNYSDASDSSPSSTSASSSSSRKRKKNTNAEEKGKQQIEDACVQYCTSSEEYGINKRGTQARVQRQFEIPIGTMNRYVKVLKNCLLLRSKSSVGIKTVRNQCKGMRVDAEVVVRAWDRFNQETINRQKGHATTKNSSRSSSRAMQSSTSRAPQSETTSSVLSTQESDHDENDMNDVSMPDDVASTPLEESSAVQQQTAQNTVLNPTKDSTSVSVLPLDLSKEELEPLPSLFSPFSPRSSFESSSLKRKQWDDFNDEDYVNKKVVLSCEEEEAIEVDDVFFEHEEFSDSEIMQEIEAYFSQDIAKEKGLRAQAVGFMKGCVAYNNDNAENTVLLEYAKIICQFKEFSSWSISPYAILYYYKRYKAHYPGLSLDEETCGKIDALSRIVPKGLLNESSEKEVAEQFAALKKERPKAVDHQCFKALFAYYKWLFPQKKHTSKEERKVEINVGIKKIRDIIKKHEVSAIPDLNPYILIEYEFIRKHTNTTAPPKHLTDDSIAILVGQVKGSIDKFPMNDDNKGITLNDRLRIINKIYGFKAKVETLYLYYKRGKEKHPQLTLHYDVKKELNLLKQELAVKKTQGQHKEEAFKQCLKCLSVYDPERRAKNLPTRYYSLIKARYPNLFSSYSALNHGFLAYRKAYSSSFDPSQVDLDPQLKEGFDKK